MADRALSLGAELELPVAAVTRTIAVVGQKGTGKTSTAVVAIEEAARAGARFAWMDPTGAASGLRASADGEGPGLDCVVMGGFHGDVPLDAGAGEVVARLVVEEGYSVVCDLEKMPRSEQVRFVADFSETALELCRSAVTIVYDEAPRFVPQGGAKLEEDGARCQLAVTEVVMLGRRKGLGSILITQRPSKLHKDVLEQADVFVSHRLMGVNDRKVIAGWLEDAGDGATGILERVPTLARGEAVVIAPEYEIAGVFAIREKRTFDSSATPDVGAVLMDAPRGRGSIDLGDLQAKMGHALEAAQENDPAALRRRIAKLEDGLAEAREAVGTGDPQRIEELETERDTYARELDEARDLVYGFKARLDAIAEIVTTQPASDETPLIGGDEPVTESRTPPGPPAPNPPAGTPNLKAGALRMLTALTDAPRSLTRSELATLAKVGKGGTMSDYLSALRRGGLIVENGATIDVTEAGLTLVAAPRRRTPQEVAEPHLADLKAGARRMLDLLMRAHPDGFTRKELSGLAGVSAGGTFSDYLSSLRRRGLIEERGRRVYAGPVLYLWEDHRAD